MPVSSDIGGKDQLAEKSYGAQAVEQAHKLVAEGGGR